MERFIHAYPAALNDDDNVGFGTKGSEYIHKAQTSKISELHTATYYKCVCDGRWIKTLTEDG